MRDFADCSALTEALSDQDAAIFCLGAYTGAVTDTELRTITFYPAFQVLFPNHVIRADDLARAMVEVVAGEQMSAEAWFSRTMTSEP
jgi:hypothetical protein